MGNFNRGNRSNRSRDDRRSSGRSFSNRGSDRPEMHEAICAECGNVCQVPFRPTIDKPVYCDDCFGAHRGKDSGRGNRNNQGPKSDQFEKKFDDLNAKLDKIIELLSPAVKKTAKSEKIEKAEKTATKPKAKKVAVKKKK